MSEVSTSPAPSDADHAGVILMLLDDAQAAQMLARLEPEELTRVGRSMCELGEIGPDRIAQAIAGFITHAQTQDIPATNRIGRFHNVMTQAVGPVKADSLLERIVPDKQTPSIELARWLAPDVLAPMIEVEHPQAIAVLLLLLEPQQAAEVLASLPAPLQPPVVERIARLGPVSHHAVTMLDQVLTDRLSRQFGTRAITMGGPRGAAEMINQAHSSVERGVMPAIGERDAELAAAIEAEMFKFDIVTALEPLAMGRLLRDIDNDVLIDALKGLSEEDRDPFFTAMSERAGEGVKEELEERGRTKASAVEAAQQTMIDEARKLAAAGEIVLPGSGGDDDYV
ncbi:MAG: FliG C-terminal domain-containing protein [Pontixanthobacter sp.]